MNAIIDMTRADARVNITWNGRNGDLRAPIPWRASNAEVLHMVTEAVRSGDVEGLPADRLANFHDHVIDRFGATTERPYNVIQLRPKTPFG